MNEAETYLEENPQELQDVVTEVSVGSAGSDSLVRHNLRFDDGSLIAVTSFRGSDGKAEAFDSEDHVPVGVGMPIVDGD